MQWHLYSRETTVVYNSSLVCRLVCCAKCFIYITTHHYYLFILLTVTIIDLLNGTQISFKLL